MEAENTFDIEVTASDLAAGIGAALERALVGQPAAGEGDGFILGFDAAASTLQAVVLESVAVITALAEEHDARVTGCSISGLMDTDEGYRLWGTIECTEIGSVPEPSTRVDDVSIEEPGDDRWRIRIRGGES